MVAYGQTGRGRTGRRTKCCNRAAGLANSHDQRPGPPPIEHGRYVTTGSLMVDPAHLKELRRLTNAGLSDCKRTLDDAGRDLFAAAVSMLAEDNVHSLKSSMMVRASAGQSIKDPVTDSERELINALEAHFIAQRTRPAMSASSSKPPCCSETNPQFRVAIMDDPAARSKPLEYARCKINCRRRYHKPKRSKQASAIHSCQNARSPIPVGM